MYYQAYLLPIQPWANWEPVFSPFSEGQERNLNSISHQVKVSINELC